MFKSAWMTSKKKIEILEKDFQPLKSREVRVKIKACGICGTDIHYFRDYPDGRPTPLGHEVSGIVEETGTEVENVTAGDTVVVMNHIACGTCENCLNQKPQACTGIITYMDEQAGMAEYLQVPDAMAIKYDGLDFASASAAEPLTVSLDLWREADIRLGDDVLIIGPGIIGLGLVKFAERSGASSVVMAGRRFTDKRGAGRKRAAELLGASLCVDTSEPQWKESLKKQYPAGFSKVIVTAPPASIPDGIELAAFGGDIIYDGISFTNDSLNLSANELHFQKKHLKTSHAIPNWGFPIALNMLKSGEIPPELLVTDRFPFSEINAAFNKAQDTNSAVIKVAVEF